MAVVTGRIIYHYFFKIICNINLPFFLDGHSSLWSKQPEMGHQR